MTKKHLFFILVYFSVTVCCSQQATKKYTDEQCNSYVLAESLQELNDNTKALVLKDSLEVLPDKIFDYPHLKVLILKGNKLKTLPDKISSLKSLEVLDVSNNQLVKLNKEISKLHNLKVLNATNNEQLYALPKGFENLNNLRVLRVDSTNITNFPTKTFQNLEELQCKVSFEYIDSLLEGAQHLRTLVCSMPYLPLPTPIRAFDEPEKYASKLDNLKKIENLTINLAHSYLDLADVCKLTSLKTLNILDVRAYKPLNAKTFIHREEEKDERLYFNSIEKQIQNCLPACKTKVTGNVEFRTPMALKPSNILKNPNNPFLAELEKEFAQHPENQRTKNRLIELYCIAVNSQLSIDEVAEATNFLRKAEELAPTNPAVIRAKFFILVFQGAHDDAKRVLEIAKANNLDKKSFEYEIEKIKKVNITPQSTIKIVEDFMKNW